MNETTETITAEVVPYTPSNAVEEYRPRILMQPEEAKALDDALRDNMRAVLHEGSDYGTIPGAGDKPTLKKPGAEKLLQWFGFGHTMERAEVERDQDGQRLGVTYRCTVTKGLPDGRTVVVAVCEGYAGYDEDRFFQTAEQAREKAEARERANAARYNRAANEAKWKYATAHKAPWNTVIKMAQKRAMVGAALQATSASSLFTQDLEDGPQAEQPAPDPTHVVADLAWKVIRSLPKNTQQAFAAHCKEQQWSPSGEWTAEQWCYALVAAGRLDLPATATEPEGGVAA